MKDFSKREFKVAFGENFFSVIITALVETLVMSFGLAVEKEDAARDYIVGRYYAERSEDNDEISMNKKLISRSKEELALEEVSALNTAYKFLEEIFSFIDDYSLDKFKAKFEAARKDRSDFDIAAEVLIKDFGMSPEKRISVVNYLAGRFYSNQANFGDEMSLQDKRYREAEKDFTPEELTILDEIYKIL